MAGKRGRPQGAKNKKKATGQAPKQRKTAPAANGTVHTDHNQVNATDLTAEQRQALFFVHQKSYVKALDIKKKADADFKNACKLIKSEGGLISDIKLSLMEPEKLDSHIRSEIEAMQRVAQWVGAPIGTQFSLLDEPNRQPSEEKAFDDGKRAGMKGEDCSPPYAQNLPQANTWRQGWHAGQELVAKGFKTKPSEQEADRGGSDDWPADGSEADQGEGQSTAGKTGFIGEGAGEEGSGATAH